MKNSLKSLNTLLAGTVALILLYANASAQVVLALNPATPVVVDSVPNGSLGAINTGHTGEAGYDFFDATNNTGPTMRKDVYSLPSYVTNVDSNLTSYDVANAANYTTQEFPGGYSQISIAGASYGTGELYYNVGNQGAIISAPLVKITLGSGTPSMFDLGLLQQDSTVETLIVSLYNVGGDLLSATDATSTLLAGQGHVNDFFYTAVSGAARGDYLVVSGTGQYQVTLGAVTFDSPEPSTYALMIAGLGALLLAARFRHGGVRL